MTALEVFAIICGIIGIIGSIVPGIPGPPVSWIGILLVFFVGQQGTCDPMTTTALFIWLGVATAVTILDYFVPAWLTKVTGGHKEASWGAVIGLFAGMMIPPVGIILGSLLGAFIGEYAFARQSAGDSLVAALGAFLGFIFGTGIKLITSGIMMYIIFKYIF